jgi:hypothetical protein
MNRKLDPGKNYRLKQKPKDTRERRIKRKTSFETFTGLSTKPRKTKTRHRTITCCKRGPFALKTKNKLNVDAKPLMES